MSSTTSPNRWVPFQCPSCFGLFRVRKSQIGETGHCPTCRSLNHLSEEAQSAAASPRASVSDPNETLLEKVSVAKPMTPEEIARREASRKTHRRQYDSSGGGGGDLNWEEETTAPVKKGTSWRVAWSLVMGTFVLLALGAHYVKNVRPDSVNRGSSVITDPKAREILNEILEKGKTDIYVDETGRDSTVDAVDQYKQFDLQEIEVVVKNFLKSETVAERMKWVRHSDRVLPLMKKFYVADEVEAEGFESLNKTATSYLDNLLTTIVQTADFLSSPIAIEKTGEGEDVKYLVDWESWVGYCEMKPEEMRIKKPTEPVLMRVIANRENYYNFTFSDDKEWTSYRMELKDSEYSFLGYAKKNSKVDEFFSVLRRKGGTNPCIIKVVYPPKARAKDQVEIVEVVSDGWIQREPEKNK